VNTPDEHAVQQSPLRIGAVIFDGMDQIAYTGPYEVLAALSDSSYTTYGLTGGDERVDHARPVHV
jgi:cyclohexyl-isocyanide hydratase